MAYRAAVLRLATVSDRARLRIKEEMQARALSQRDLADILTARTHESWSQSRIGKVLTGYVELRLEDVAAMADAVGLSLVEVIRDRGLEFFAELTPTEVRMLELLRRDQHILRGVMEILRMVGDVPKSTGAVQKRRKRGRPRNSELENRPSESNG